VSFRRLSSSVAVLVAAFALAAAASSAGARQVAAHAASTRCSLRGAYTKLGPSYVTSLRVDHTSCHFGKRLVRDYDKCRRRSGGARGRCHSKVLGYRCTERRTGISVQFDAKVTCARGDRRVRFTYVQNT
jgi:hypothetical protein